MIYLLFCILILLALILILYDTRKQWRNQIGYTERKYLHGGYIYMFKTEYPWLIKIGRAVDPVARLRSFKTANAGGVHVVAIIKVKDSAKAEKFIHKYFGAYRISKRNEWFRVNLGLSLFIFLVRNRSLTERIERCIR